MDKDRIKLLAHISEVRKNLDAIEKILNDKRSVYEAQDCVCNKCGTRNRNTVHGTKCMWCKIEGAIAVASE